MRDLRSTARLVQASGIAALMSAFAMGCAKTPEPDPSGAPPRTAMTPGARPAESAPAAAKPGPVDIGWETPSAWEKVENPNAMRKATYKIVRTKGDAEDAEMSVSQAGGTVDMNVKRWTGQFETKGPEAIKTTERTSNGLKVTVVEIRGTFTGSGMPGGPAGPPKEGYALLGAIVEVGSTPWFFKLTGPEKTIDAARGDFDRLVESIRAK